MKRYWVFWGWDYYPAGGAEDNHEGLDSLDDAIEFAKNKLLGDPEWCHIFDAEKDVILWRNKQ
jgi:hypothetical protein